MNTDEEEYARRVLTPLREDAEAPPGPSTVDVAEVMVRGRRRVRVRRLLGAGCAAATVLVIGAAVPIGAAVLRERTAASPEQPAAPGVTASPAPTPSGPPAPTGCTVARLTDPKRTGRSIVTGIDPTGRLILGRIYPGGDRHQVLIWGDGVPVLVTVPGLDQSLTDVNSSGMAVGISFYSKGVRGWVYRAGKVTRLTGRSAVTPLATGESGLIVGSRTIAKDGYSVVPVIWRSPDEPAEDLSRPGPTWYGQAVDVAPDGTVIGLLSQREHQHSRGFLWTPDGARRQLPLPVLDGERADGFAPVSLGDRWVSGVAYYDFPGGSGFSLRPVRYDRSTGEFQGLSGGLFPEAGNARGWLVGQGMAKGPSLLTDTGALDLPVVPRLNDHRATGVSDDGRVIVGQAFDKERVQALVWHCR
jgi:hypothetical protein